MPAPARPPANPTGAALPAGLHADAPLPVGQYSDAPLPAGLYADAPLPLRERQYSPSSCIGGNYQPFIHAYRQRSAQARIDARQAGGRWSRHALSAAPSHALELCLPATAGAGAPAPVMLFVHGGYWQELAAADSLFAATACVELGIGFAALDYTLAPAASLDTIIGECLEALNWLSTHAAALGIARERVAIAGSSAGAHLCAAMVLGAREARAAGRAVVMPRGAVLVSGVYWLEPLIGTSIDAALRLDTAAARRASPGLAALAGLPEVHVAWGEVETEAFKAQSHAFVRRLHEAGVRCSASEVPGRNHFDVVLDLAAPDSVLGRRALELLG
ncbi:MAG: alpha/beta hydrolase fold domain-containing protein [Rubrivivax sp.]|nr:alpha/beta hydrolase fold domain-containing protein [Rubrivivax sp.]